MDNGLPGFPPWRPSWWYSRTATGAHPLSRTGLSPSTAGRSRHLPLTDAFLTPSWIGRSTVAPHNPRTATPAGYHAGRVWALPVSLATTQGMLSFPPATEMFQFADLPPPGLWIQPGVTGHYPSRVSPFGHPRITACSQLPGAFRRLPRPSSALGAKASTPCPV